METKGHMTILLFHQLRPFLAPSEFNQWKR